MRRLSNFTSTSESSGGVHSSASEPRHPERPRGYPRRAGANPVGVAHGAETSTHERAPLRPPSSRIGSPGIALRPSGRRGRGDRAGRLAPATGLLAALALAFGLAADAYGLHSCPHHHGHVSHGDEPLGQESHAPTPSPHGDAPQGAETLHTGSSEDPAPEHDGPHHNHADSGDEEEHEGPCACLGACAGAATPSLPVAEPGAPLNQYSGPDARAGPAELLPHHIHIPHVLPYPLGPPSYASL